MGDFSAMDGGDEPVSDSANHFVKVGLGREDVDCSLQRYWDVVWGDGRDVGSVGDWVERDGKTRRGWRSGGGRLIGEVDRQHSIMEEGVSRVDCVVEIGVGMVESQDGVGDEGWSLATLL
jgi:hypothetical protein